MVYPASFHRLVMIGDLYSDMFNVTLSMVPSGAGSLPAVTQSLIDATASAVATWWALPLSSGGTGVNIISAAKLTSVKLNRIGANGRYVDDDAHEKILSTPVAGAAGLNIAPQLSVATTLRGVSPRSAAGKGRMYFPPSSLCTNLISDGRFDAAWALQQAKGVRNLLAILNDVYLSAGVPAVAGIASKVGAGAFQGVHEVSVGRVVDTIRSRRSKQAEEPEKITM